MRGNKVPRQMASYAVAALVASVALLAAGCASSGGSPPAVPSLSQSGAQGTGGAGSARGNALHVAAQCIRQHGVPGYTDPVLTPSGSVYTDTRSIQDVPQSVRDAINQACGALLARANLNPLEEPPAPPQLVEAGVRAAECERANGMPNVTDPTARSNYTPGHGFGMSGAEMPPGGKGSPIWQHAYHACYAQITAEIQASTLGNLGNDG